MLQLPRSKRKPDFIALHNPADQIEHFLHEDNHRKWGFVIYRCNYDSDADWAEFLKRLRYHVDNTLEYYNGLDMLDSFEFTVFEDKINLDGASKSRVREIFKNWAAFAVEGEQGVANPKMAQRYRYCIHVDADVLQSVVHDAVAPPRPEGRGPGFVNLVSRYWKPNPGDLMEERENLVEGSDRHDVGWMKVDYISAIVTFYNLLRDWDDWEREYRRPPQIARG